MNSITYPYLSDLRFLKELDELNTKEQFVKIIVLDWLENPIANIEGRVSGGSMNLDGSSAVRRSGSITFICDDEYYNVLDVNNLISINKKIKIEIGYANTTDKYTEYDKIWFPQGVFVIINPSITHNNQGLSIAISFKDKMCLLNGECGGVLPASVTFHEREEEDGTITRVTYYQIIQELVSEFGGEQLGKIIINDVDTRIKKVMKWVGDEPIEFLNAGGLNTTNSTNGAEGWSSNDTGDQWVWRYQGNSELILPVTIVVSKGTGERSPKWVSCYDNNSQGQLNQFKNLDQVIMRFGKNVPSELTFTCNPEASLEGLINISTNTKDIYMPQEDIGYIYTDFCPTSDLVGNAGQNVVTILDNIKKQLGNYEYFYDIDGNFIFQEIRNYLNTSQSTNEYNTLISQGYLTPALAKSVYQFTDSKLIAAYQNTPQYANIKNDFIVWGIRESAAGAKMPIRYHVAFDTKPQVGNTYKCITKMEEDLEHITGVIDTSWQSNGEIKTSLNTVDGKPALDIGRPSVLYYSQESGTPSKRYFRFASIPIGTSSFTDIISSKSFTSDNVTTYYDTYRYTFDNIGLSSNKWYLLEVYYKDNSSFKINIEKKEDDVDFAYYQPAVKTNGDVSVPVFVASTASAISSSHINTNNIICYYFDNKTQGKETLSSLCLTVQRNKNENGPKVKETYAILYSFDEKRDWVELGEGTDIKTVTTQNYQTELYIHGVTMPGSNRYYSELAAEWPKMFQLVNKDGNGWTDELLYSQALDNNIPASPDYYLDIIEPTSKIGEFSIPSIGVRSKVWSDNAVNCLFEADVPSRILIETGTPHTEADRNEAMSNKDSYYQVPSSIYNALAGGGYQNSAFNAIRDVLYQYTNYNESITLTALPIYYLEPNTRITVEDEKSSIHGDYMIKSISRPFDCNGTMQITATKALERF